MRYYTCYGITPKPELRDCPDLDQELVEILWDEPWLIRNAEGGRTVWSHADYKAVVKLLFLLSQRSEYGDSFFKGAPLSVELFDRWWTIERYPEPIDAREILENVDPRHLEGTPNTGREHVDQYLRTLRENKPRSEFPVDRSMYRVWYNGDVIGWIKEPKWDLPYLRGRWFPTVNPAGKAFAAESRDAERYHVVIDGDNYLHSELQLESGSVVVKVAFASSEKS